MGRPGLQPLVNGSRVAGVAGRSHKAAARAKSVGEIRSLLAGRIRARLHELRAATATRAHAIADPHDVADPAYLGSLDDAVAAAVEYRLAVLELGERQAPAVPSVLLAQARLDARNRVPLDAVLRRYCAGASLFGDCVAEEAEGASVPSRVLRRLLGEQATLDDRLLAAVSSEHGREAESRPGSADEWRRECVKSLLAGELLDHSELGYDLNGRHLALIVKGAGGDELMRGLAATLDRRLLAVQREEVPIWAGWLGGRHPLDVERTLAVLADVVPDRVFVTVGEPGEGLSGWRLSHRQAKAALPVAERHAQPVLRYADVALLAAVVRDDLVADSLRQLYLAPLERARDGGKVARKTLHAYFAAERNVTSTAAALGVDRHTVRNRLRAIEAQLGRSLKGSVAELEIALRLDG